MSGSGEVPFQLLANRIATGGAVTLSIVWEKDGSFIGKELKIGLYDTAGGCWHKDGILLRPETNGSVILSIHCPEHFMIGAHLDLGERQGQYGIALQVPATMGEQRT